jgi:hypothetical protein
MVPGDVVMTSGMRVLVVDPPTRSQSHGSEHDARGGVWWTSGIVVNVDEVRAEGFVPMSFLWDREWIDGRGWVSGRDLGRDPRWTLQGNDWGTYSVARTEIPECPEPPEMWCPHGTDPSCDCLDDDDDDETAAPETTETTETASPIYALACDDGSVHGPWDLCRCEEIPPAAPEKGSAR